MIPAEPNGLTVIIPAHNEEAGIGCTLEALRKEPRLAEARLLVIDDGSTDRTAAVAQEHGAEVLQHPRNRGYGASLKTGIRAARSDLVAWFDADGQHDPADLANMVERLQQEGADAIFAAREQGGHVVWSRQPGKLVIRLAAESAVGRRIPDVNCGLRVFRRVLLVRYLSLFPDGFSASTTCTLVYLQRNYRVAFHPIRRARVGQSTVRQLRDGGRTLHTILRILILFNAFRSFTLASGFLVAVGLVYGITVALLQGLGFPVLAALMVILGIQVFTIGVVCDQVSALRLDLLEAQPTEPEPGPTVQGGRNVRHCRHLGPSGDGPVDQRV